MKLRSVFLSKRPSRKRTTVGAAVALATLSVGCSPYPRLQELSAPEVQCGQEEITISELEGSNQAATYLADCRGRTFRCNSVARPMQDPMTVCESLDAPAEETPVASPTPPAPVEWREVRLESCGAVASFPADPVRLPAPNGVPGETVELSGPNASLTVTCAEVPESEVPPEQVLDGAIGGMVDNIQGTLRSRKPVGNGVGASIVIDLPRGQGQVLSRVFLQDRWLYFAILVPRHHFTNDELTRFFGGFKLPAASAP